MRDVLGMGGEERRGEEGGKQSWLRGEEEGKTRWEVENRGAEW